jgi:hypothetical protein
MHTFERASRARHKFVSKQIKYKVTTWDLNMPREEETSYILMAASI